MAGPSVSKAATLARIRIVAINDVYELANLPRLQTFLTRLSSSPPPPPPGAAAAAAAAYLGGGRPAAVVLAGDFLSPSALSSIDGGRGMVAALKTVGITHVSLGNHEADLPLPSLQARLSDLVSSSSSTSSSSLNDMSNGENRNDLIDGEAASKKPGMQRKATASRLALPPPIVVLNSNIRRDLPENAQWMASSSSSVSSSDLTQPYSIVTSPCGQVRVALLGLLSDEPGIFRDGTFKGAPIQNVLETYTQLHQQLVSVGASGDSNNLSSTSGSSTKRNDSMLQRGGPIADFILPLTHQSMTRDRELARHMLILEDGPGIILGGHEHEPHDDIVTLHHDVPRDYQEEEGGGGDVRINDDYLSERPPSTAATTPCPSFSSQISLPTLTIDGKYIRILKSGTDARNATLLDLTFEVPPPTGDSDDEAGADPIRQTLHRPRLVHVSANLVDLSQYDPSPIAQQVMDKHMSVIESLDDEVIIDIHDSIVLLPPGVALSSQSTRFRQTTVGSVFCQMIKEELEVDAALINGASIKGDRSYDDGKMSYAHLKAELPFPTKMVVVSMRRHELEEAVHYSRTAIEDGSNLDRGGGRRNVEEELPRRGYLQVDYDYDTVEQFESLNDLLQVAVPRNLLNGFCKIAPLMDVGLRLKREGRFPGEDDFVPALDLVVRHACKNRWFQIMGGENHSFRYFDLNDDGVLDRYEIKAMMRDVLGHEPADFVVDDMIASIDKDDNGVVDHGEFSFLLAQMEREQSGRKH